MPVSPAEILQLSRELQAMDGSEVLQRCVISRAYYATLHATDLTFPRTEGSVRIDGESSHAEIISRAVVFGKSVKLGRTSAALVAQALPRLRKFRNHADYRLHEPLSAREYADVVVRAERVLQLCEDVVQKRAKAEAQIALSGPLSGYKDDVNASPPEVNPPQTPEQTAIPRPSLKRIK